MLGEHGLLAERLSRAKNPARRQMYSLSLLSAISKESLLANQLIEGGVDATIFENFLYRLLVHVRESPEFAGRQVVLLMDNAAIHHHRRVVDLALRMKAILLYNPQYSPWLNPVEKLFKYLKGHLRSQPSATR
mgnify:FL=1